MHTSIKLAADLISQGPGRSCQSTMEVISGHMYMHAKEIANLRQLCLPNVK